MKPVVPKLQYALMLVIGSVLAAGPVSAEKPAWAGSGKNTQDERSDGGDGRRDQQRSEQRDERHDDNRKTRRHERDSAGDRQGHFDDRHQAIVRDYYGEQFRSGRCPPGLAKKHNGCMPPGQAKKWQVGQPLSREVVYYDVPQPLVLQIGPPPSGYRYVRVASDILMIAIGSGMVVEAIRDLGR